jgi:hypothetical protein
MTQIVEGEYQINGNSLINPNSNIILEVGIRHRPKKGQASRFLGYKDPTKPEPDNYKYISGLYAKQGTKNWYTFDSEKTYYDLVVTALNKVIIRKSDIQALPFEPETSSPGAQAPLNWEVA